MNLKVSNSVTTKTYALTNAAPAKPYLNVSNSFLPLTTNTTSGLKLKVTKNNNTYRALEYGTVSSSDTFYTSANVSDGLSSTTGLTRVSTSGTTYLTRASTSGTNYGTRASTSNTVYGTRASTSGTKYGTRASTSATSYLTRASTSGTTYLTRASTSGTNTITEYTSIVNSYIGYVSISFRDVVFESSKISYSRSNTSSSFLRTTQNYYYAFSGFSHITKGIRFQASDIRKNDFQKITYDKTIYYDYMRAGTPNVGYTNITYGKSTTVVVAATASTYSWGEDKTNYKTIPQAYPNLTYTKYFPWDTGTYGAFGMRPRSYYSYTNGDYAYGMAHPLLTSSYWGSTTSQTYAGSTKSSTMSQSNAIGFVELLYSETLKPTTRASYLTRASTSNTVYGTRASTSNTVYGTRASTSGTTYLTRASTSGTTYYTRVSTSGTTYLTRASTSGTNYGTRASTSGYSGVSSSSNSTTSWI